MRYTLHRYFWVYFTVSLKTTWNATTSISISLTFWRNFQLIFQVFKWANEWVPFSNFIRCSSKLTKTAYTNQIIWDTNAWLKRKNKSSIKFAFQLFRLFSFILFFLSEVGKNVIPQQSVQCTNVHVSSAILRCYFPSPFISNRTIVMCYSKQARATRAPQICNVLHFHMQSCTGKRLKRMNERKEEAEKCASETLSFGAAKNVRCRVCVHCTRWHWTKLPGLF